MMRFEFLPEAASEAEEAAEWYAMQRPGLGQEFEADLVRVLRGVIERPESRAILFGHYRAALLRKFPYRVVYLASGGVLVVVAVYHTSRDPGELKDRLRRNP